MTSGFILEESVDVAAEIRVRAVAQRDAERLASPRKASKVNQQRKGYP